MKIPKRLQTHPQTLALGLSLVLTTLTTASSYATSFYPQPFPETVSQAPNIVRGTVGDSYADYGKGPEGMRQIFTFYDLQVKEVLKGNAPSPNITIRELGGEKDGVGLQIPGTSSYSKNEDVVVFLNDKSDDDHSYPVQGMMMGKFNVQQGENGTEYLIGAAFDNEGPATPQRVPKKWTLNELRELIKQQSGKEAASPPKPAEQANTATVAPKQEAAPSTEAPAPQLQSSSPQESQLPKSLILVAVIAGIGLLGLLIRFLLSK